MRSKRLTRLNKLHDDEEHEEASKESSKTKKDKISKNKQLSVSKREEPRGFVSTSTPAKTRTEGGFSDDTDEDITLALRDTPTALRMKSFLHDEFLSSQTGDVQIDVRWEHTSPDAYKYLQRVHRKQKKEDLADIVCIMAPAFNENGVDDKLASSTPPLLCSWLQANKATSSNVPFDGQIFKPNHRAKRTMKKKKRSCVQKFDDVLTNLHMCLERFDDEEAKAANKRSSVEVESDGMTDRNENNVLMADGARESSLLPRDAAQALEEEEEEEEEEIWSDEELFHDNSFILQATQLPADPVAKFSASLFGGKRKQVSPISHQPQHKAKKYGISPPWEKDDSIPPTCPKSRSSFTNNSAFKRDGAGKVEQRGSLSHAMRSISRTDNNVNVNRNLPKYPAISGLQESNRVVRSATSPFRKHSSFSSDGVQNDSSANNKRQQNSSKSPWRKTTSFSGRPTQCSSGIQGPITRNLIHNKNTSNVSNVAPSSVTMNLLQQQNRSVNGVQSEWSSYVVNGQRGSKSGCSVVNGSMKGGVNSVTRTANVLLNPAHTITKTMLNNSNNATNTALGSGNNAINPLRSGNNAMKTAHRSGNNATNHLRSGNNAMNTALRSGKTLPSTTASPVTSLNKKPVVLSKKMASPIGSPRSKLDTSFSDEILRQLAEPDEHLESQAMTGTQKMSDKSMGELEELFDSESDFSINTDGSDSTTPQKSSPSNGTREVFSDSKPVKMTIKTSLHKSGNLQTKNYGNVTTVNSTILNRTGVNTSSRSNSSQVPASQNRFKFHPSNIQQVSISSSKTSTASSRPSPAGPCPVPSTSEACPVPPTSTSRDIAKTTSGISEVTAETSAAKSNSTQPSLSDTQVLMSSQAIIEDDSFMKDDALFESQILAMLDEVENAASQQSSSSQTEDSEKISCSPVEIEKKRLAALEKLKKKKKK